jgi:hypothetical protein
MNRMCPRPKKGAGLAQGERGASIQQEISRWNMTLSFLKKSTFAKQSLPQRGINLSHGPIYLAFFLSIM